MPAVPSTWTRFAPVTAREEKIRSGINGWRAVFLPDDESTKERQRACPQAEHPGRQPALLRRGIDDREDSKHHRAGDQKRPWHISTRPVSGAAIALDHPQRRDSGGRADRQVDEEDPVPVQRLGEDAPRQQAHRRAGGRDEGEHADRLGLFLGFGKHGHDHAEDYRGGRSAAHPLQEPCPDQHLPVRRQPAQQRRGGEYGQPGQEHVPAPGQVAESPGQLGTAWLAHVPAASQVGRSHAYVRQLASSAVRAV